MLLDDRLHLYRSQELAIVLGLVLTLLHYNRALLCTAVTRLCAVRDGRLTGSRLE